MEVIAQEHVIAQKHEFLPAWDSLDSTPTMGSSTGIALATLDTALYSKHFQTFNFAPRFQNF